MHTFVALQVHARPLLVELQELGYSVMDVDSGKTVVADTFAGEAILALPGKQGGDA